MRLLIVRHGLSVTNNANRYTGQTDVPLTERGVKEGECTSQYLLAHYGIDAVYSSDLSRAYNTVKPLAEALGLPIHTMAELRELDVGEWRGRLFTEVRDSNPESFRRFHEDPMNASPDGGENYTQLQTRAVAAMEKIAKENPDKTVAVGTHGGLIRSLMAKWLDLPDIKSIPLFANASVTVVDYDGERFTVKEQNLHGHLNAVECDATTPV